MKYEPLFDDQLSGSDCIIYGALLLAKGTPTLVLSGAARLEDDSRRELLTELLSRLQGEAWSNVEPDQVSVSDPSQHLPTVEIKRLRLAVRVAEDGQVATFFLSDRSEFNIISETTAALLQNQAQEVLHLRGLSTTDYLTGLKNRRYMRSKLSEMIAISERYSYIFSLALMDLDHFKNINSIHGYAAGDSVLASVALRLQSSLRSADSIMRYGGDEFVLITPATDCDGCVAAVARLQTELETAPHEIENLDLAPLSFSTGIVEFNPSITDQTPDTILEKADAQLRSAKLQGPGTIRF